MSAVRIVRRTRLMQWVPPLQNTRRRPPPHGTEQFGTVVRLLAAATRAYVITLVGNCWWTGPGGRSTGYAAVWKRLCFSVVRELEYRLPYPTKPAVYGTTFRANQIESNDIVVISKSSVRRKYSEYKHSWTLMSKLVRG